MLRLLFTEFVHNAFERSAAYGLDIEVVARAVQGDKRVVVESAEHTAADGVGYGNAFSAMNDPDPQRARLDAKPEERARRRVKQNEEKGIECNFEEVLENIKFRDYNDKTSDVAPLKQAEDAVYVDSSELSIEEVVEKIIEIINKKKKE